MNTITYQIETRFGGYCTQCGKHIAKKTKVNWTPNEGIRHLKECKEAIETRQETREAQSEKVGRVNIMELAQ